MTGLIKVEKYAEPNVKTALIGNKSDYNVKKID